MAESTNRLLDGSEYLAANAAAGAALSTPADADEVQAGVTEFLAGR